MKKNITIVIKNQMVDVTLWLKAKQIHWTQTMSKLITRPSVVKKEKKDV